MARLIAEVGDAYNKLIATAVQEVQAGGQAAVSSLFLCVGGGWGKQMPGQQCRGTSKQTICRSAYGTITSLKVSIPLVHTFHTFLHRCGSPSRPCWRLQPTRTSPSPPCRLTSGASWPGSCRRPAGPRGGRRQQRPRQALPRAFQRLTQTVRAGGRVQGGSEVLVRGGVYGRHLSPSGSQCRPPVHLTPPHLMCPH